MNPNHNKTPQTALMSSYQITQDGITAASNTVPSAKRPSNPSIGSYTDRTISGIPSSTTVQLDMGTGEIEVESPIIVEWYYVRTEYGGLMEGYPTWIEASNPQISLDEEKNPKMAQSLKYRVRTELSLTRKTHTIFTVNDKLATERKTYNTKEKIIDSFTWMGIIQKIQDKNQTGGGYGNVLVKDVVTAQQPEGYAEMRNFVDADIEIGDDLYLILEQRQDSEGYYFQFDICSARGTKFPHVQEYVEPFVGTDLFEDEDGMDVEYEQQYQEVTPFVAKIGTVSKVGARSSASQIQRGWEKQDKICLSKLPVIGMKSVYKIMEN